ncbi:MAG: hybrid sensor histidine kinase/response regulator [Gammaproteobacteria bacterium]
MNTGKSNLLKLFFITSICTFIIAAIVISWFYKNFAVNLLEEQSTDTNVVLSKTIHNSLHIGIETKLGVSNLFSNDSLKFITDQKNHPFLTTIIHDSIEETPIVKVKMFNPKLKVIYSTVKENIGKTMDEKNIREVIKTGKNYTEINYYDEFNTGGQILKNKTLLTTYIPMKIPHEMTSLQIDEYGLFGIYVDVTEQYHSIIRSQWKFVGVISIVFIILYSVVFFEIRRINQITEEKQINLDNELRKAEKTNLVLGKNFAKVATKRDRAVKENEAKSQFLANVSHELRTPLNAIIGYSEMISDDMDDGVIDRVKEDSCRINSAGKHLLIIINDILDISKIEAGKMELSIETFNVNDMISELVATSKPLADKNNNKLQLTSNNLTRKINSDLTRTRQILLNLISNAIKFTKDGIVSITVNDTILNGEKAVEFIVKDTGIGLDEIYINKIFRPFDQADLSSAKKYEGTGLGLTISKLFCELLNGNISVTSKLGQGSTFSVIIPVEVIGKTSNTEISDSRTQQKEYCAKVLVVDDNPDARKIVTAILTDLNFYVITASSGLDGLRVAQNDNIDIIILDVLLSGLDGWTLFRTLKNDATTKNIKVVLSSMVNEHEITKSVGADAYLTKPFNKELVEETMCNLVGGNDSAVSA